MLTLPPTMRFHPLARLLPIGALAFTLVACQEKTAAPAGDSSAAGGTLVIASPEPDVLFPPLAQTGAAREVVDNIYEHLAEIGPDLSTIGDKGFTPRLAQSWDWAKDSLSIAFHLNPKARWHDGKPVIAEDVVQSFRIYKDSTSGAGLGPLLANVDSVTARDSATAVAWFHAHTPSEFYDFAYNIVILPSHLLKGVRMDQLKNSSLARTPVGTNRFRFVKWEPGSRVEIVADTANYRGRAKLDRVIWTPSADFNAGASQFFAGQADWLETLLPDQIARVDSNPALKAVPYPGLQYAFLGFNLNDPKALNRPHPIFGDRNVRLALSMAVDREGMLRNVFGSLGKVGHGPFPATVSTADTTIPLPPHDVARAKALLDSLGWKPGADGIRVKNGRPLAFSILVPTSSRARMSYATLLQNQFHDVGAKVEIDALDLAAFFAKHNARQFDADLDAYSADPSPAGFTQVWGTASIGKGGANVVGYSNPKTDALVDSAMASFDPAAVKSFMQRAYRQAVDDAPAVWLYDVLTVAGAQKRVHFTGLRPDGWWVNLPDWTIPPAERNARDKAGATGGTR